LDWKSRIVSPDKVIARLRPGMNIFLGTGMAEPRTLVKYLMETKSADLQDLELLQLGSFGDAARHRDQGPRKKYRLKTFFSGSLAKAAIEEGRMDLIPCRPSRIPQLIESRQLTIDAAFFQISAPNKAGYCSLGVSVDVALLAMEQASLKVGEISPHIPRTVGDTYVHMSDFDMLVESTEPPIYFPRPVVDEVTDQLAGNVASVIDDESCLAFSLNPFFEALGRHLTHKRHLGIHSPFFTDALMDLMRSGAVTNRRKANWRGKSVVSYVFGTQELMSWLDRNPLVELQGIDKVYDSINIGKNPKVVAIAVAEKVDLTGRIVLPDAGVGVINDMGGTIDFFNGAGLSPSGLRVIALTSRDKGGWPNIRLSVEGFSNQFGARETVDLIITEYGVANLYGRTIRERAQALIDIAHPDDRPGLVEQAKEARILYPDQIYLAESAHLYPDDISDRQTFKGGVEIRFRALRPSDEEEMRRLFYRFSEQGVYFRYFTQIRAMPHNKMQEYVNVDYNRFLSIVALEGDPGKEKIVAEARYAKLQVRPYAEVAFVVDEAYQGLGIASHLIRMLIQAAKERGIQGFTASVLRGNEPMMRVFEKSGLTIKARMEEGIYSLTMPFAGE
jgi:acyl-CoA hydrolase/RimJ/RimL family protein N-acetyltransferase